MALKYKVLCSQYIFLPHCLREANRYLRAVEVGVVVDCGGGGGGLGGRGLGGGGGW